MPKDQYDILGQAQQSREKEQMLAFKQAVDASPYIVCNCGNGTYVQASFLKNVSGLRTGNGVDLIVPQQIFICANCGSIISGYEENKQVYPDKFNVVTGRELTEEESELLKKKPTEEVKEEPKTEEAPKSNLIL